MTRRPRLVAALLVLIALAAACGQKAGVAGSEVATGGVTAGGTATDDLGEGTAVGSGEPGAVTGDTTAGGTGGGSTAGGSTGGATTSGGAAPAPGAATSGGGTAGGPAPAGDRTGISDTKMVIGLHAPLTGAAPVPTQSFRNGVPVYWKFIDKTQKGVFGRSVEVKFYDDEFNPSTAVSVCRRMVEQDKVFLLIGIAGADQITACAKYASSVGVPYLSAGVNQEGLESLRGYFAASQTYVQQNVMLAQLAKRLSKNGKFGLVVEDTPTFREARSTIESNVKSQGLNVVYAKNLSKGAGPAEMLTIANELRTSGADVVYFLGPPANPQGGGLVALAQQGQGQGYTPAYIGPGLSAGLNIITQAGCPGLQNAKYFSPFPQLDVIDKYDPDFKRAYRAETGGEADDIGLGLWGLAKGLHQMFLAAGKDMTRQSFVATLESGKPFESKIYSRVQYSPKSHFGAQTSHLLAADCGSRTWKTEAAFVSGF